MEFRVYIAAPFNDREDAIRLRSELAKVGIGCTARWIDSHKKETLTEFERAEEAKWDLYDIRMSDAFVIFADKVSTSGGMYIEAGYALHEDIPVIAIGTKPNSLFFSLPQATRVLSIDSAVETLRQEFGL